MNTIQMLMPKIKSAIASAVSDMYMSRLDIALDGVASDTNTNDISYGTFENYQSMCKLVEIQLSSMPGLPEVKRAGFIDQVCKMVTVNELTDLTDSNWINTEIIKIANRYETELRDWLAEIVDLNNLRFEDHRNAIDTIVRFVCAQDNRPS